MRLKREIVTMGQPDVDPQAQVGVLIAQVRLGGHHADQRQRAAIVVGGDVALVEPRTYLGREVTATLRPWLHLSERPAAARLPEVISASLAASGAEVRDPQPRHSEWAQGERAVDHGAAG